MGVPDPAVTPPVGVADLVTWKAPSLVTSVVVVSVEQVPLQLGPVHVAVLLIVVPPASAASAVTAKLTMASWPAPSPAPTVQVMVPPDVATDTVQLGAVLAVSDPQLAEPATSVVPEGAASVMVTAPVVGEPPVFWTISW